MGRKGRYKDITGQTFGRLFVIEYAGSTASGDALWLCECTCGNTHTVKGSTLRTGHSRSCGCLQRDKVTIHGMTHTPTYKSWDSMLQRCYSKNAPNYHLYGGRGITVCDEWRESLTNFISDIGVRPEGTSLDRIDVNGNYEPSNCRWATAKEQNRNRRNSIIVTYKGETKSLASFAEEHNILYVTLIKRIKVQGLSIEEAIERPVQKRKINNASVLPTTASVECKTLRPTS